MSALRAIEIAARGPRPRRLATAYVVLLISASGCMTTGRPAPSQMTGPVTAATEPSVARRLSDPRPPFDPALVHAQQPAADDDDDDEDAAMAPPSGTTGGPPGEGGSSLSPIKNREGPFDVKDEANKDGPEEGVNGYVQPDLLMKHFFGEDRRDRIYGWAEAAYLGNPAGPRNHLNLPNTTSDMANRLQVPQLYLVAERTLEKTDEVDWGYRFDNLFGTDWQIFHEDGFFDRAFRPGQVGWEPTQFYGDLHLPVLTDGGVDVRIGRWISLAGYESAFAPGRPLRSTGFLWNYSHPFTHLGVLTTLNVTDRLQVFNAAVNGWDRWFNQHDQWGYVGGIDWTSEDERTNLAFSGYAGPNQISRQLPRALDVGLLPGQSPDDLRIPRRQQRGDSTMLISAVLSRQWDDRWLSIFEVDYGSETNIPLYASASSPTKNSAWYGGGAWLLLKINDRWTGVFRADVFRDAGGVRTGFDDLYESATLGLIYKPRPWLWFRPEIRYDAAQGPSPFDDRRANNQLTLGFDALLLF